MPTAAEITEVVRSSSTKREAASRLGTNASSVGARIQIHIPHLLPRWRDLPADGAFAGRDNELPIPCRAQHEADALVAEAATDSPIDPEESQRASVVRLMLAMYAISGSIDFPRGWVRALILAFEAAGARRPTVKSVRWYRSRLADVPDSFASVSNVDLQLLDDLGQIDR